MFIWLYYIVGKWGNLVNVLCIYYIIIYQRKIIGLVKVLKGETVTKRKPKLPTLVKVILEPKPLILELDRKKGVLIKIINRKKKTGGRGNFKLIRKINGQTKIPSYRG